MKFSGQYLTFDEYRQLGGTLDIMPFNLLEFEIRKELDSRTQNRLARVKNIPQEVKLCVLAMIKKINSYANDENINRSISSESVGSYSVNYLTGNEIIEAIKSKKSELEDIMRKYLTTTVVNGTSLLYLGVC